MSDMTRKPADSRPVVAKHGRVTDLEGAPRGAARRGGGEGPAGPARLFSSKRHYVI